MRKKSVIFNIPVPKFIDYLILFIQLPLVFMLPLTALYARFFRLPKMQGRDRRLMISRINNGLSIKRNFRVWHSQFGVIKSSHKENRNV
jgi:hypothetical protein